MNRKEIDGNDCTESEWIAAPEDADNDMSARYNDP